MPCNRVEMGGGAGIVCTRGRRAPLCKCGSGLRVSRECDWKMGGGKTCDAKLCGQCSTVPAPEKDLCPKHAGEWNAQRAAKAVQGC